LSSPLPLSVRQYGVMSCLPSASSSPAARAAMPAKMPVVMGQPKLALYFFAI